MLCIFKSLKANEKHLLDSSAHYFTIAYTKYTKKEKENNFFAHAIYSTLYKIWKEALLLI